MLTVSLLKLLIYNGVSISEAFSRTGYLSNRPHFLWVYRSDNPRGMLGEHEKSLYLQAFRVFSQHPARVITPVNP